MVVSLHDGIKHFMQAYAFALAEPFFDKFTADEVVEGELLTKADYLAKIHFGEPGAVEFYFYFLEVKDFGCLLFVGFPVLFDLFFCKDGAFGFFVRGVSYSGGEVADEEGDMMARLSKGLEFAKADGVAQVEFGSSGVVSGVDF